MNIEGLSTVEEVDEEIEKLLTRRREILIVSDNALLMQVKERIQYYVLNPSQFKNEKLSDYLATKLNKNPHYLCNLFHKREGITIQDFKIRLRVEEVKVLLRIGKYTVQKISEKLGYSSIAHLCNEFKKVSGLTTFEWKKSHLNFQL